MSESAETPGQASPEATGGAGTIEEYRLAAVALARLLVGDVLPGLPSAPTRVELQRSAAGHALDDLVLRSETPTGEIGIDYQAKRTMAPIPSDKAFTDALAQCLATLQSRAEALTAGSLRMGLASASPIDQLEQLRDLTRLARDHDTAASLLGVLVPRVTDAKVCRRYGWVKKAVAKVAQARGDDATDLDELTHRFLRYTHIWIIDVAPDGREVLEAISRLGGILPRGGPTAQQAFDALVALAQEWGPGAGVVTAPMVRAELLRRGIPLTADGRFRVELARVEGDSRRELANTPDEMGGKLRLEREEALAELAGAINQGGLILVSGLAGVGKSVLARRAVRALAEPATVVAVNLTARGNDSLATIQSEWGVTHLPSVLAAAPTTGPRVLLIDGAEHALTDSGRLLLALVDAAPMDGVSSPPWTVVVTSRADAAPNLVQRLGQRPVTHLRIHQLSDEEVVQVTTTFPELAALTRHPRSRRLLTRPYLVDLLVKARVTPAEGTLLGEEDVAELTLNKIIRLDEGLIPGRGTAHARASATVRLAESFIRGSGGDRLSDCDGEAVAGLVSDDVLVRERSLYRFAHDVMADYACALRLAEDDAGELLAGVASPRPLLRSVRLAIQRRLSDAGADGTAVLAAWRWALALCAQLIVTDGPRWDDVPYESLISLGQPERALEALRAELLASEGAQLGRLMEVTGRFGTTSEHEPDTDTFRLDAVLAGPVVAFLANVGAALPFRWTLAAIKLSRRWLLATELEGRRPGASMPDLAVLTDAIAGWTEDDAYGDRLTEALTSFAFLGEAVTPPMREVIERAADRGEQFEHVVEYREPAAALSRTNPDLLLELAGRYYMDLPIALDPKDQPARRPPRPHTHRFGGQLVHSTLSGYDDEEGVRNHRPGRVMRGLGLAHPSLGPFAVLLERSPDHGLRLVGAVVDAATAARVRVEQGFKYEYRPAVLALQLPGWPEPITYEGPGGAWGWYQMGGTGSYVAMSALMALRQWALAQPETRPLADVVNDVLGTSHSIAVASVAYSLLLTHLEAAGELIDDFLASPVVWELDLGRVFGTNFLGYRWPDVEKLGRIPEHVTMEVVLRADSDRRAVLAGLGQRLLETTRTDLTADDGVAPPPDHPALLVAEKRARVFDIEAYRGEPTEDPGQISISVDVPSEIMEGLERSGGKESALSSRLHSLAFTATQVRDGQKPDVNAAELFTEVHETVTELVKLSGDDPVFMGPEALAAVAAAVVLRAGCAEAVQERGLLPQAVGDLLEVAARVTPEERDFSDGRRQAWDFGPDRSAATALPLLLTDEGLLVASGRGREEIRTALLQLAQSPSAEVRHRLVQALDALWDAPCDDEQSLAAHTAALSTYDELLLTAGLGPWSGITRPKVRMEPPLADALQAPEILFEVGIAADAIPGLRNASTCDCAHGTEARSTLEVLVDHDLKAWPDHWAGKLYDGSESWRSHLDQWAASGILAGDDALLQRYLDGFSEVPEELAGLLVALTEQALNAEQGERLLTLWPAVMDRLLPEARTVRTGDRRPHHRDVAALDDALLPKRPAEATWPSRPWGLVLQRWVAAYTNRPDRCDRLIKCLAPQGVLLAEGVVPIVLMVAGSNAKRIVRDSQLITAWLQLMLVDHPDAAGRYRVDLHSLVDSLVSAGSSDALAIQRALEA